MPETSVPVVLRDAQRCAASAVLVFAQQGADQSRVCVRLDSRAPVDLSIGAEVAIEVEASASDAAVSAPARVVQHRKAGEWSQYHLDLVERASPLLSLLVNRRGSLRVRPSVTAPVEAEVGTPDRAALARGSVRDLSLTGLGVLIARPEDPRLYRAPSLFVRFELAGDAAPFEMRATLLSRRPAGRLLHYGVRFDEKRTKDFDALSSRLAAWIVARQARAPVVSS